jgi:thioredoxin-related protein
VVEVTGDAVRFVDYRVDLERDRETIARYQVVLSPTLVFLDAAGAEVFRHQGLMDAAQIQEKLAAFKLWVRKG